MEDGLQHSHGTLSTWSCLSVWRKAEKCEFSCSSTTFLGSRFTTEGRFTTAPILVHPDPELQFIVEVDASNVGVGAILSQHSAEQNYDIGNMVLLAVKLALEEWRQWLEGAQVPFLVWADHKNLEYLQTAKILISRQARWALFFSRFNFHLAFRPGAKNVKPDSLSRYFEGPTKDNEPDTILRPEVFIHANEMNIERTVQEALGTDAAPSKCPVGRLFVPAYDPFLIKHNDFCIHPGLHLVLLFRRNTSRQMETTAKIQNGGTSFSHMEFKLRKAGWNGAQWSPHVAPKWQFTQAHVAKLTLKIQVSLLKHCFQARIRFPHENDKLSLVLHTCW